LLSIASRDGERIRGLPFIRSLPAIVRRLPDDGWSICGWFVFFVGAS